MVEAGVDVIEVGFPYSDPVMDGPVIQQASDIALAGGVRTADMLRIVEAVAATGAPVVTMTYWNPIERYGVDAFARDLAAAGGTGLITPDLIPDEARRVAGRLRRARAGPDFLVSPSSTDARLAMTVAALPWLRLRDRVMGVTGARARPPTPRRRWSPGSGRSPTCRSVSVWVLAPARRPATSPGYADGVIVGSALVRCLLDAPDRGGGAGRVAYPQRRTRRGRP